MNSNNNIKEFIRKEAFELGFQDVGFAKIEPLIKEIENFKQWLKVGYNADMNWLNKNQEKRTNPQEIVLDAKSIIVLAYNYFTPAKHPHKNELNGKAGKISRYAWGDDYHDIVQPKTQELANLIKNKFTNENFRCYTDTGPVLEKIWAERSGIGWQGKNSLIISKKYGSYFFLSVIITTLEIEEESKVKDYCLSCRKCIVACPTDAIVQDKVVDSRRCLSYWTIEAKPDKNIPIEIAQKSENWLFGCDICQDVCPWNKNLPIPTENKSFEPRNNETALNFEEIKTMTQEEFAVRFKKSPIKRPKLAGLKRNVRDLDLEN